MPLYEYPIRKHGVVIGSVISTSQYAVYRGLHQYFKGKGKGADAMIKYDVGKRHGLSCR